MQVIAHRGASAYAPEHSFEAYDLALAMGAHAIELDLRVARDGALVVHTTGSIASRGRSLSTTCWRATAVRRATGWS